jgi:meiotically up-regulated gene 157 (Mug157) protein
MTKIKINTFATWDSLSNAFHNNRSPLLLQIDVENKTDEKVIIDSICFSVKHNYLLYKTSKDILKKTKKYAISPKMTFSLELDAQYLLNRYSPNKKFNVKIISNNEVFESDVVNLGALKVYNENNS